ncbi:hypothetical protein [Palleronia pontilimi]|uniref:hypothetical protein n=1 Tax=Palleronia pontilimi TaxID=1964209 RepID=UPI001F2276EC|nr:hypothetical protein [Palleronia pontilimi]
MPDGAFQARYAGRGWNCVKSSLVNGRSQKLVAHETGGAGYISLNFYRLSCGNTRLFPCEMSHEKVVRFVTECTVTDPPAR